MSALANGAQLPTTQEEFEAWCTGPDGPECGHFEFLFGCVVAEPPAAWPHGEVSGTLGGRLGAFVREHRLGRFFDASQGFALPTGDTLEPDAAVVLAATWQAAPAPTVGRFLRVVPDLVVEVLSPRTERRDRGPKRELYERNGVREYWLVAPRSREVTILSLEAVGRYGVGETITETGHARSRVLPGFSVRSDELFPMA
jgi:Uma2 family endonuclease